MQFSQLALSPPVLRAVQEEGYSEATPIQVGAIPPILAGRDLLGCAQTGTGKTAAFALPILDRLEAAAPAAPGARRRPVRCLVLTPTRELASQILASFRAYGRHLPLQSTVIFGGVGQHPQVQALQRGIDILVATPGRLLDLIRQRHADLQSVEILVLDEADRMLDMGFINDIRAILRTIPARRQTLFFSATMPREIQSLADSMLHDPVRVAVAPVSSAAETVLQSVYMVAKADKSALLCHLLQDASITRALAFSRTKHGADKVAKVLAKAGIEAAAIHGNKSQNARQRALDLFKRGTVRVLVASDIAARGLDIDAISHVINVDLPNEPETYVHRIGRTGRAGASGIAISFCDGEERAFLTQIERTIRSRIPVVADHPFTAARAHERVRPPADPDDERSERERPPGRFARERRTTGFRSSGGLGGPSAGQGIRRGPGQGPAHAGSSGRARQRPAGG